MEPFERLRIAIAEALNKTEMHKQGSFTVSSGEVVALEIAVTEALPHLLEVTRRRWGQVRVVIEDGKVTYVLPEFSHKVRWR